MKLAVVVSTYNRPDTLVRVLDGLLNQSILPHEIIVADDGSTKETYKAIEPYLEKKQPVISHVWQEDKGFRLAHIRNKAIKASCSEYLVFLDGDCIPQRDFVKDHMKLARKGCFFQGKRVIVNKEASDWFSFEDTDSVLSLFKHLVCSRISNGHHIVRLPFLPPYTTKKLSGIRGCNMAFFKSDLEGVNGFNQAFKGWGREDSEIVIRLYSYGIKRREHPFRAICYHLWHPENSRDSMEQNDRLLEEAMASKNYYCREGLTDKT